MTESEARQLSRQYLDRMKVLEVRIAAKEKEHDVLRSNLQALNSNRMRTSKEKEELRTQYEARMVQVGPGHRPLGVGWSCVLLCAMKWGCE